MVDKDMLRCSDGAWNRPLGPAYKLESDSPDRIEAGQEESRVHGASRNGTGNLIFNEMESGVGAHYPRGTGDERKNGRGEETLGWLVR